MHVTSLTLSRAILLASLLFASAYSMAFTVTMNTSRPSPAPLGTTVVLGAELSGEHSPEMEYQFLSLDFSTGKWSMHSDYSPAPLYTWTSLREGLHLLVVIARDRVSNESQLAFVPYGLLERSVGGLAVINPTKNALVGLFSAPSCDVGLVRVRFRNLLGDPWQYTPLEPCQSGKHINTYLAGMLPTTVYQAQVEIFVAGNVAYGPIAWFTTGAVATALELATVTKTADATTSLQDSILLNSYLIRGGSTNYFMATDLLGRPVWYFDEVARDDQRGAVLASPVQGGSMLMILRQGDISSQILREIDLAGNIVKETNVRRVSDQLELMGQDRITSFHHDAQRLENDHTIVVASVERILTDVQGPGPINVLGDMIVDLDENLQVVWAWNGFDHLDVTEKAILDEVCVSQGPGCPPIFLTEEANDWTHANSVDYSPADGHLIVSMRHHDSVYKLDYANGTGSGAVVWRLGHNGDFSYNSNSAWPQFSHQHDARYSGPLLTVFDNGNIRRQELGAQENSRGQVLLLDETNMVAHLVGNFDLGVYSFAVGSGEQLRNGNFFFTNGFINPGPSASHQSEEVTPGGASSFVTAGPGTTYRAFRMQSLYEP